MFNGNVNYNNPQIPMASTVPVQGSPPPVYAQPPQTYQPAGLPQPYAPQPAYGADQARFSPQMPVQSPAPAVEVGLFDKMKSYFNDVYRSDDNLRAYKVFQSEVDNNPATLKPGSGDKTRVSDLQQKLNIAGFKANVNGIYGYATGEAVKEFKVKMGLNDGYLDADGKPAVSDIATPQMQSVLQSVVSRKLSGQPGPVNPLPITQEDMLWAQNLMTRVQNFGYKPSQQEYDRYQDILARQQQNGAPAMPVPAQPAPPVYAPQPAPPVYAPNPTAPVQGAVTQQELDWAMQMQDRIVQGYRPNPQEAAAYENIQQRYAAQQPAAPAAPQPSGQLRPVTQEELDWATQMQDRIIKGYRPNQAEADRYTDIFNRYQSQPANPGTPPAPPKPEKPAYDPGVTAPVVVDNTVSEQELQWAMDLQKRIDTQGYRPTQHEIARYTDIYTRYQAQQAQQPVAPTQPAAPTQPQQPAAPTQPAVPTQPQQPVAPPVQRGATMDEIRWANQLEDKMAKGIQASADELYQYNQIQMKLANYGVASTAPAAPTAPTAPTAGSLTQSEIDWALQLQHKVQFEGYQPTQQEVAAYTQIFALYQQLLASQQAQPQPQPQAPMQPVQPIAPAQPVAPSAPMAPAAPSGARPVTQEEVQWASQLQQLVQGGYQASEQEIATYTDIYNRMQGGVSAQAPAAPTAPTAPAPQPAPVAPGSVMINVGATDPELQWALELLNRYRQGYQPSAPELTMYEQIIGRKAVPGATP
ncbi:MAG: peptidoglycan-binding protein [Candidatus Sericytochromatia bacterium]|nr:peptidoglycan-binding protein [Candidatus Sericytochromatia bacterium]